MISVIIPLYNQERYIQDCLASLAAQTMDDFEVIIVDDGSTDSSAELAADFAAQDSRFTLMRQANAGVSTARNRGLDQATGQWVCFVDPDDSVDKDYLATLLAASAEQQDIDIVMSTCVALTDDGEVRQHFFPESFVAHTAQDKERLFHQLIDGAFEQSDGFVTAIGVPWGKLYRRDFLAEHDLRFDPALPRMQDNLFNMEAFQHARAITYLDYAGYRYRVGGLSERTYRNTIKGLYHPAIDRRAELMHAYGLDQVPQLYQAWQVEQVNLYYQELKAAAMLTDGSAAQVARVVRARADTLRQRTAQVDAAVLPRPIRLKYRMLIAPAMTTLAALALARQRH
ncbi:glycosyltransferase [Bifidobacterium cuniculi]|uniref:Glycosyltransferase n=1 Tax=Bifidobacterium cuniculi TaxID=1688 RepID=A0A087AEW1_9BIFI|nr:glycosyltransferase [Bifidobacterium cuniculi]KFI57311.1 glycosyltransferase [Bifidobacterium cuniculi]